MNKKGKEARTASNTDEIDNYIDLTKETKKHIKQKNPVSWQFNP